ncbi:MAG: DUF5916 domain-containing protein [Vicinamibacterales bacterium]
MSVGGPWAWFVTVRGAAAIGLSAAVVGVGPTAIPAEAADAGAGIQYAPVRVDAPPTWESWQSVPAVREFVQREPLEGGPASQDTEFRVAYDATTLFVMVRAFDERPDGLSAYLTRRDEASPSDWIRILVDSYHDRRTAYEFAVNPAGVKQDRYWYADIQHDAGWDAIWDVEVVRDDHGWAAEFRIPLSQLRFRAAASTFGFAVMRELARVNETATWPLLPRSASGFVSSFGELTGFALSAAPKRLDILPYAVATLTQHPSERNPLLDAKAPGGAAGVDLKYAWTPALTVTATINPDFGQVEADPAVVNLTAFETFFAERRPFFVEGAGMFRFGEECPNGPCAMFYSRRIGRAPQGNLDAGSGTYRAAPLQTTILGAAKVTGRVGPYAIGALHALTDAESGTLLQAGQRLQRPVEPLTSYSVARVRREFADQSAVGFIATAVNRRVSAPLTFLTDRAYTGGVDWDLRLGRWYSLNGHVAGSTVSGSPEALRRIQVASQHYFQRPDATSFAFDPSRTSLSGSSSRFGVTKLGGQHLRFRASVGYTSPGFETNDVGFLRRADERWTDNSVQFRREVPIGWIRYLYVWFNQWASWNFDGDRIRGGHNVTVTVRFVNNWAAGGGAGPDWRVFDDRLTRGGPGGLANGPTFFWSWMNSDDRRPVSFRVTAAGNRDRQGSWSREHEVRLTYRPRPALMMTAGILFVHDVRDTQWVQRVLAPDPHDVFGRLDQTTATLTGRFDYTITPNLSVQLYAQPFLSAGEYSAFKELVDGRQRVYAMRYSPFPFDDAPGVNPDFNVRSLQMTNVLRWEFRPGSTLFAVWQQAREGFGADPRFSFGRDFSGIFGSPARNVFLVKLAYWLNR